jgi:dipeptidyl aminopeptidase/acylaminoacyl peptidase
MNVPKVDSVSFSPCEKYVILYCPSKDKPYQVWNFGENTMIREFEQAQGEDAKAFKWSYDGTFLAKITKKAVKKEEEVKASEAEEDQIEEQEEEENLITYITVYEMPVCKVIQDQQGDRTSIKVDGLEEFEWAPHKNIIAHTSFPDGENALPRITL